MSLCTGTYLLARPGVARHVHLTMKHRSPYIGPKAQSGAAVSNPHTNLRDARGGMGYDSLQDPHLISHLRTPKKFQHLLQVRSNTDILRALKQSVFFSTCLSDNTVSYPHVVPARPPSTPRQRALPCILLRTQVLHGKHAHNKWRKKIRS